MFASKKGKEGFMEGETMAVFIFNLLPFLLLKLSQFN